MNCPDCKKRVKDNDKFCPKCGLALTPKCPYCSKVMGPGALLGGRETIGISFDEKKTLSKSISKLFRVDTNCIVLSARTMTKSFRNFFSPVASGHKCKQCKKIFIPHHTSEDLFYELRDPPKKSTKEVECSKCKESTKSNDEFCRGCGTYICPLCYGSMDEGKFIDPLYMIEKSCFRWQYDKDGVGVLSGMIKSNRIHKKIYDSPKAWFCIKCRMAVANSWK